MFLMEIFFMAPKEENSLKCHFKWPVWLKDKIVTQVRSWIRHNTGPASAKMLPKSGCQYCAIPRCEFRSAARVGPSGHGWPYFGYQGLVTIVEPTVVFTVLTTLAANTGNQRCARPSAQLWPRFEPTAGPTLANCSRWPWQFSQPTFGPRLNQSSAYL